MQERLKKIFAEQGRPATDLKFGGGDKHGFGVNTSSAAIERLRQELKTDRSNIPPVVKIKSPKGSKSSS